MTLAAPTPEWMTRAVCSRVDPELFFPDDRAAADDARNVCSLCPVRAECLEYALEHDVRYGVWGGLTPVQRGRIRRRKWTCRRCGAPVPDYRRHYCDACKPIVRSEINARYKQSVRAS